MAPNTTNMAPTQPPTQATTQIFVDSTAYLTEAQLAQYNIQVLSLSVNFEDESLDEALVDYSYFYTKLAQSRQLPSSSQPNPHTVQEAFKKALAAGHHLFVITLSSEMSGTFQTAKMLLEELKEDYPDRQMTLVDSRSNCMQLGFQALAAAEVLAAAEDITALHQRAVAAAQHTLRASRFIFIADTLKYLEKGGRIGKASAFLGTLLSIKPVLTVEAGRTDAIGKVRTRQKALEHIAERVARDVADRGFKRACIHHIDNPEGVKALIAALPPVVAANIPVVSIGPVIGTHVGPGAVGIVYETQQPDPAQTDPAQFPSEEQ